MRADRQARNEERNFCKGLLDMQTEQFIVSSFYAFFPVQPDALPRLAESFCAKAKELSIDGLLLLGDEGINATISGGAQAITDFKLFLGQVFPGQTIEFKDSSCAKRPFRRFKLEIRPEIVSAGRPDLKPWDFSEKRLEPVDWQRELETNPEALVIDTRNLYESKIGKFNSALLPEINHFRDFIEEFKKWNVPRDKKLLIYCTGGIRCEKAALQLAELGYQQVYQLSGGILKYLEAFPNKEFQGECFVFDHRVAVDQDLKPSQRYGLCPHCGNPSTQKIDCSICAKHARICEECSKHEDLRTCSKNCAYHFRLRSAAAQNPRPKCA